MEGNSIIHNYIWFPYVFPPLVNVDIILLIRVYRLADKINRTKKIGYNKKSIFRALQK